MFVTVGAGSVIVANSGIAPLGVFGVAVAHGIALSIAITAFGGISGGHLNPAVTLSLWLGGRVRLTDAFGYVVAQVLGGVAAGGLLLAMFGRTADAIQLGTPGPRAGFGTGRVILVEAVFTFFLAVVMWATMVDERGRKVGGFGVGLSLLVGMLITAQFTGGVLNPARHFGTAVAAGHMRYWWVYWLGPAIGGVVAGLVYPTLFLDRRFPWRLVPALGEPGPTAEEPPRRTRGRSN
jgi:MIP family channel proteins